MRVAVSDFRVVPAEASWLRRRGLWSSQTANANAIANVNGEPLKSGSPCVIRRTCEWRCARARRGWRIEWRRRGLRVSSAVVARDSSVAANGKAQRKQGRDPAAAVACEPQGAAAFIALPWPAPSPAFPGRWAWRRGRSCRWPTIVSRPRRTRSRWSPRWAHRRHRRGQGCGCGARR